MRRVAVLVLLNTLFMAGSSDAAELPPNGGFSIPVQCRLGDDCWVMNYPDMANGSAVADPSCGPRSYDGHRGTDIAVRDLATMDRGVPVLAAAVGVVLRRRDGIDDRGMERGSSPGDPDGRECGNGVVLDHGQGWQTQYCHLRRGSVAVTPGVRVAEGEQIGLVGFSGKTEFPHLHIAIRRQGDDVDPLSGRALSQGCGESTGSLWKPGAHQTYQPAAIYAAGFAAGPVTSAKIKRLAATPARFDVTAPAMVVWAAIFGVRAGDRLTLEITGPDRKPLVSRTTVIGRARAWHLQYAGLRRKSDRWGAGEYQGRTILERGSGQGQWKTERIANLRIE